MRDGPWRILTRHFFNGFFDFGFLSEAGAESVERVLLGAAAVAVGLGLLLVRIFIGKYAGLSAGTVEMYERAVVADHAFLIALPMWIIACTVVLVGHALFPDETDYRILMAEPVSRGAIFGAKLTALLLFAGLFVAGAQAALAPLFVLSMLSPAGTGTLAGYTAAYATSSLAASLFAALTVVALHGLLVLLAPRAQLMALATIVRSGLMAVLVLSLPLLLRLPGTARAFAANAWWLRWAPPAWFVGLERWLLGDGARATLAIQAVAATTVAAGIAVASYAILYRRFDRVTLQSGRPYAGRPTLARVPVGGTRHPVRRAVVTFTSMTLRRSMLHQGIIVALTAAAAGFVVNGLIAANVPQWWRSGGAAGPGVREILLWAPLALMFIASPAVRLALSVPIELRANWIFRMTEDRETRADAIGAGVGTVMRHGVVLPIAAVAPLQWLALGRLANAVIGMELIVGWLLVEVLMRDWRRIPFTCSYLPGKGFVPHMFVKGVGSFLAFTALGVGLLEVCILLPRKAPVVAILLSAPALALLVRRRRQAASVDLAFEDELPSEINPLRLNAD